MTAMRAASVKAATRHRRLGTTADRVPKPTGSTVKSRGSEPSGELAQNGPIPLNHRVQSAVRPESKTPLAMQKVVGSSPIIRFLSKPP
jgi:hypothetical protein